MDAFEEPLQALHVSVDLPVPEAPVLETELAGHTFVLFDARQYQSLQMMTARLQA